MNNEEIREYCLSKNGVTESFPFNDTALVFKVGGKMFALLDLSDENRGIALKCDPDLAIQLREEYAEITPAYHFSKKHWNGVRTDGNLSETLIRKFINHAYDAVFNGLPKKQQALLNKTL